MPPDGGRATRIDGRAIAASIRLREEPRARALLAGSPARRAVLFVRGDRADSAAYRGS